MKIVQQISLHTDRPIDSTTEVRAAGYHRVMCDMSLSKTNKASVRFPVALEDWPEVKFLGLRDFDGRLVAIIPVAVNPSIPGTVRVWDRGAIARKGESLDLNLNVELSL